MKGDCKIFGKAEIDGSFIIRDQVIMKDNVSIRGLGSIVGSVKITEQFTSICRLIISGYDEPITLKGSVNIGSGIYLSESYFFQEDKFTVLARVSSGKLIYNQPFSKY